MYDTIWRPSTVRYDLTVLFCTIQSHNDCWYDIYLGATHTTILSIRGVTIPSYLVSSATDSTRQSAVVFKPVLVPTSDPKSEFLCQSSLIAQNLQFPLNHLVCLGIHPRLRPSRITHTVIARVLSLSILRLNSAPREPNDLVAAFLLKSSRMFHLNVTRVEADSEDDVAMVIQLEKGLMSRHPALSTYQRLTHKPWVSHSHALRLLDWQLVSVYDCVGTPE